MKSKVLTQEELQKMAATSCEDGYNDVHRAFITSCFTGMEFLDAKSLKFSNIENKMLEFIMHSTGVLVRIPLTDSLSDLIGKGKKDELIFPHLPSSYAKCTKILTNWAHAAGIDKQVGWSYARHFFACSLVANNATSIEIVANLLGHSYYGKDRYIYLNLMDKANREAMEKLPKLKFKV